jgi:hypothetical protein
MKPVVEEVLRAFRSFGSSGAAEAREAVLARGERAVEEVCAALRAGAPLGEPGANGRAVVEDLEDLLSRLASAYTASFVEEVLRAPALVGSFAVLSAAGQVPGPAAAALLEQALASRDGSMRWLALTRLIERSDPRLVPLLGKLLADRDGLVVFAAVGALRRWGGAEHLDGLERVIAERRTPIGTREGALDALEAICSRLGRPPPGGRPRRLLELPLAGAQKLLVIEGSQVAAGEPLAEGPDGPLRAPCAGVVVGLERDGGSRPVRLVLRRLTSSG